MAIVERDWFVLIALAIFSATLPGSVSAQTRTLGNGASSEGAGAQFAASGKTATLDCGNGKAEIAGSNNKLTLTGGCASLQLLGSGNTVTVALAIAPPLESVTIPLILPGV